MGRLYINKRDFSTTAKVQGDMRSTLVGMTIIYFKIKDHDTIFGSWFPINMKIAFITILFHTPVEEIERLKTEINNLGFTDFGFYPVDNTVNNRGFAAATNEGIKKALADEAQIFVILNPDISFAQITKELILETANVFDVFGFSFQEKNKKYFGGEIDKLRASGGLIEKKPKRKFVETDFVSGSFMVIKKDVVDKIGVFDESYFLYYEDVDYSLRAKKAGFKVGIDTTIIYKRLENSSLNPQKKYSLFRAKLLFLLKQGTFKQKLFEFVRFPKTFIEEFAFFKSYLIKRPFLFNFFSLNFSSLFNQGIHFFLFLFLINTLSVQQYGVYTLIWAHIGLLSPLLDFGTTSYGLVYLSQESKNRFSSLYSLRIILSVIVFFATILLAFIFKYNGTLLFYTILVSFVIFSNMFSGTYLILTSLKQKLYMASYVSMIFNLVSTVGFMIVMFLTRSFNLLFISIFIFYSLFSIANYFLIRAEVVRISFKFDFATWTPILKRSVVFLLISSLAGLYFKLDVFLLNFLKGPRDVGIYSSGYKFLDALMMIAASYNISATPILGNLVKKSKIEFLAKVKKDIIFLFLISFAILMSILIFSPIVFPYILKGDYFRAIDILRIVIFALPFILMTSVFLNSLYVMGKAYIVIFIFLFQIIFNLTLNYIFIPHYSYYASAYITVIGEIINTLLTFAVFRLYLRKLRT